MMRLRRQNRADKSIDLANFNRAMDRVNQLSNITVANGTVRYDPSGVHIAVNPEKDEFPWDKSSFGYEINPDGDNPAEVLIHTGFLDMEYLSPITYWAPEARFTLEAGEKTIYACGRRLVTGGGDPHPSFNALILDEPIESEIGYWRCFMLYTFTCETMGDPPVAKINDSKTLIHRFLNIITSSRKGTTIPDGDADNPNLIWDVGAGEWVIGKIVPDGSEAYPHLVWNHSTEEWEADKLLVLPEGGDEYLAAIWSPTENEWTTVNMEVGAYKVFGVDGGETPTMDYVRWV